MARQLLYALAITANAFLFGCTDPEAEDVSTTTSMSRLTPQQVANSSGIAETHSLLGTLPELEANNAFFKNMGTTGRTCKSCHAAAGGWTPSASQELWNDTNGTDPLFMFTHDVGVCPNGDITRKRDRRDVMKLLLERGLTRGGATVQPTAEFEVTAIEDPFSCPTATLTTFFGYRKPNPTVGISQKSSVTWAPAPQPDMRLTLNNLVIGATRVHGLTTYTPTEEEQRQGTDFMLFTYFAQIKDRAAGRLDDDGARGGPLHLSEQDWFVGINHSSTGETTRKVFDIYDAWIDADAACNDDDDDDHDSDSDSDSDDDSDRGRRGGGHGRHDCDKLERRALIAEGQEIFNFRQNANGGTCSGCHNSPNVGTRSVYQLFDIGIVDVADPDLPRVHLRNKTTGEVRVVSNLGRAAATGRWSDIGRMKVPTLRGLASRAPYFSSGQARSLDDVVKHYDQRFTFGFTKRERKALVAFLKAL
jgi:hypothetical protein